MKMTTFGTLARPQLVVHGRGRDGVGFYGPTGRVVTADEADGNVVFVNIPGESVINIAALQRFLAGGGALPHKESDENDVDYILRVVDFMNRCVRVRGSL